MKAERVGLLTFFGRGEQFTAQFLVRRENGLGTFGEVGGWIGASNPGGGLRDARVCPSQGTPRAFCGRAPPPTLRLLRGQRDAVHRQTLQSS